MAKHATKTQYEDVRKQIGHYTKWDYHPEIRPAGKTVLESGLEECFREYKLQDGIDASKNILRIRKNPAYYESYKRNVDNQNVGMFTEVKECVAPIKQSPFQVFVAELKDTTMSSYWKKELGRIPDQTPNLPAGMVPTETTFGKSNPQTETAADLVNPCKTDAEVMLHSHIGHRLYRKSHNNYYPSEQVNREYEKPYNKYCCYGQQSNADYTGQRVKKATRWSNQDVASTVSCLQADFLDNTQSCLGRVVLNPEIAHSLSHHAFGKSSDHGIFGVYEILGNLPPGNEKLLQKRYLANINTIRLSLKKRIPMFPFAELHHTFVTHDKEKRKIMSMEKIYLLLSAFKIRPEKPLFEKLLNTLGLMTDGNVNYEDIINLLDWRYDFPTLPKIDDVPLKHQHYCSTYKDTICEADFLEGPKRHTAGLPTERVDVPYAVVPQGRPRCDRESLGDQTSVATIISPNLFTQYGLSHIDFFKGREKQQIRSVFENIGVEFPGDSFDIIWKQGLKKDSTGRVCIETFRGLLDQLAAATYEDIPPK